jgi:hypothetical protein
VSDSDGESECGGTNTPDALIDAGKGEGEASVEFCALCIEGVGESVILGCVECHCKSRLAEVCRRYDTVSGSKRCVINTDSSDGRSGWMYSGDMRREASIVSRSGPLMDVMVYGAVAVVSEDTDEVGGGSWGREDVLGSREDFSLDCSEGARRSEWAMRAMTLVSSESCDIRSWSSLRWSV